MEAIKTLQKKLNLRYKPTQFSNRAAAFGWAKTTTKMSMVILGDNGKFWIVCPSDASRLIRAGYELAQ